MSAQDSNFAKLEQVRVAIANPNEWVAVDIPIGARDPWMTVEDATATMRISTISTVNPATEGFPFPDSYPFKLRGTCVNPTRVFVSSSAAPTNAVLIFTKDRA